MTASHLLSDSGDIRFIMPRGMTRLSITIVIFDNLNSQKWLRYSLIPCVFVYRTSVTVSESRVEVQKYIYIYNERVEEGVQYACVTKEKRLSVQSARG